MLRNPNCRGSREHYYSTHLHPYTHASNPPNFLEIQEVTERRVIPGKSSLLTKAIKHILLLPIRPMLFLCIIFTALFDAFLHVTCASSPVRGITWFQCAFIELVEKDLLPWGWMDPSYVNLDEQRSVECDTIWYVDQLSISSQPGPWQPATTPPIFNPTPTRLIHQTTHLSLQQRQRLRASAGE